MINKLKGFTDKWDLNLEKEQFIIKKLNNFANKNGFRFLVVPSIENELTFSKTLGNYSDIIKKEFFYVDNKKKMNEKYVLRPELTSGVIRAAVEKKELKLKNPFNVYTFGNCFRYEKPQKGRYREFLQWSLEQIFTNKENYLIFFSFLNIILDFFQLKNTTTLRINYLSKIQLEEVQKKFEKNFKILKLCNICEERKNNNNIYRILDCKKCGKYISEKINLYSFLTKKDKEEYEQKEKELKKILPNLKIERKDSLTRGLDYYNGLVFELFFDDSEENWAKNVILAGGEYNLHSFSKDEFNKNEKGIGFAIGIERLIIVLEKNNYFKNNNILNKKEKVLISIINENFKFDALKLSSDLIKKFNNFLIFNDLKSKPFLKVLEKNIKKEIKWMIYFGKEYLNNEKIFIKKITNKNEDKIQFIVSFDKVFEILEEK